MSLTGYLLNSLWQFPVVVSATWVLARLLARKDPLLRYRLLLAGLVLSVVLPVCPKPELSFPSAPQAHGVPYGEHLLQGANINRTQHSSIAVVLEILPYAFFGAVFLGSAQLLVGALGTFHMAKSSAPAILPRTALVRYKALAKGLGLSTFVTLRVHARVHSPAVAGWRKPVILLPRSASSWAESDLSAALSHELVHVARNDSFWNIVSRLLLLPLLFHPLAWWLRRQIDLAREMVCDEMAATLSENRQAYAQALLSIGRASIHSRQGLLLNWYTEHPLEERIMQLLSSKTGKQATRWSLPFSIASLIGVAFALTLGSSLFIHAQSGTATIAPTAAPAQPVKTAKIPLPPLAIAKGARAHVKKERGTFEHQWKAADGDNVVVLTQSPEPPSVEERLETRLHESKTTLASMSSLLNDKRSSLDIAGMQTRIHTAQLALDDAEIRKTIAGFQQQLKDGFFQRKLKNAEATLQNAREQ